MFVRAYTREQPDASTVGSLLHESRKWSVLSKELTSIPTTNLRWCMFFQFIREEFWTMLILSCVFNVCDTFISCNLLFTLWITLQGKIFPWPFFSTKSVTAQASTYPCLHPNRVLTIHGLEFKHFVHGIKMRISNKWLIIHRLGMARDATFLFYSRFVCFAVQHDNVQSPFWIRLSASTSKLMP